MSRKMNDSGISTVVGLILILGLIVSVAAVVKLTYIPDVKKQLEADHMQHVIADIGDLKAQLDMLQAASLTGIGYSSGAAIEMGGGAIPGIDPSTTYGTLTMDPSYGTFTVSGYNDSGVPMSFGSTTVLGHLLYQSNNHYFADQNVSYESGMVILAQPGGSVMLTPPSFAVLTDPRMGGRPIISFNPVRMSGTYQSFSSAGTGTVKTSLLPGSSFFLTSTNITNVTFTITSDYAPLWFSFLDSSMAGSGVPAANYTLVRNANTVTLFIAGKNASFSMIDSTFGAAMGYGYAVPGSPTGTPGSTPTPTPAPTPVPQPLTAGFTANATSGPAPLAVAFTDQSTDTPNSWSWSFGDTGTSAGQNPVHVYSSPGTCTVTLTIQNATGGTSTKMITGYITTTSLSSPFDHLDVVPSKTTVGDSELFNVTVTARDGLGNIYTGFGWTISLDTNQTPSHLHNGVASYTFTPVDAGVHIFANLYFHPSNKAPYFIQVTNTTTGVYFRSGPINIA